MSREEDLGFKVRNYFEELLGEIDELRESLSDLEDRVSELEDGEDSIVSTVRFLRSDGGEVGLDSG